MRCRNSSNDFHQNFRLIKQTSWLDVPLDGSSPRGRIGGVSIATGAGFLGTLEHCPIFELPKLQHVLKCTIHCGLLSNAGITLRNVDQISDYPQFMNQEE
jgi:hypothetical protein